MSHRHLYTVNRGARHPWLRLHQHYCSVINVAIPQFLPLATPFLLIINLMMHYQHQMSSANFALNDKLNNILPLLNTGVLHLLGEEGIG